MPNFLYHVLKEQSEFKRGISFLSQKSFFTEICEVLQALKNKKPT